MANPTCSVEDCETPARTASSPYCEKHYYRLRRKGTLTANPWHRRGTCTAPECSKDEKADGLCDMHRTRVRRTGSLDGLHPQRRGLCSIEGCEAKHAGNGWCQKHARRARTNGHPLVVRQPKPPTGPGHHNWAGDGVTYEGMHQRLRAQLGSASLYGCVDCGTTANDWSYDHRDPDEIPSSDGPYSLDHAHYHPRCRPCHIIFDRRILTGKRWA